MIVDLGFAVERMPTDGKGGSVAATATGGTGITLTSTPGFVTLSHVAGIVAGTLLLASNGGWCMVTGSPSGLIVPIDYWRKPGQQSNVINNLGSSRGYGTPIAGTHTYKAFAGAGIFARDGGWTINAYALGIAVAGTLTIQKPTGSLAYTLPVNIAGQASASFGLGMHIDGPFTITPSLATILGQIEFLPA